MRTHTIAFKNNINKFGRELDTIITYTINNETVVLGNDELNNVTLIQKSNLLKSSMRKVTIDSNELIPVGQTINIQLGVKTRDNEVIDYRDNYDYVDFGNFIVKEYNIKEDTRSYEIICYDKMLYSMIPYQNMNIQYPVTVREYITEICNAIGLTFKNENETFANYDKMITSELYLNYDEDEQKYYDLGYTFRDVLDELAEVTASIICINNDDELEIRYPYNTQDTIDEDYLKSINVEFGEMYGPINTILLSRSAEADTIHYPDPLPTTPIAIKIVDNQIMNGNNRDIFLPDIYNKLNGLEYYLNDFSSTGVCYYDIYDKYNIIIGENIYNCLLLNSEINITQGLKEDIYTELSEQSETDYKSSSKEDIRNNTAYLIVKKNESKIEGLASRINTLNNTLDSVEATIDSQQAKINVISTNIDEYGNVTEVKTINGFTFDKNGLNISNNESNFNTQIDNVSTKYKDGDKVITETSKDGFMTTDLKEKGSHRYNFNGYDYDFVAERIEVDGEYPYAHFYNGN